jgi:hypothetical protein
VKKKTRRKMARSGHEECPVCTQRRMLVEHHIHGRDIPNSEAPWNRAWICPSCHDEVHAGKVVIEGWLKTTAGKVLGWHHSGEEPQFFPGAEPNLYASGLWKKARNRNDMKTMTKPPPCPVCGSDPVIADRSSVGYGDKGSGKVWKCRKWPDCDTYVGCHPGTTKPLGTLADRELRSMRKRAHNAFDWSWKHGGMTRDGAYGLMREELGLPSEDAHIGMMDIETFKKTIRIFNGRKPWKAPKF